MKRSKLCVNSSSEKRALFSIKHTDIEGCQEEIIMMRKKYNKLNQDYLELKVEYNKLEQEYKYNIKFMEAVIKEANASVISELLDEGKCNDNSNNENYKNNEIKQNNLSKETIKLLKEKSIYEKLKLEIMGLKDELREKENIIEELKKNVKTSKFKELDYKYAEVFKELNIVKNRNNELENIQQDYINSKNQIIFLFQQIDLYKKENKKQKEQIEKLILLNQNSIIKKEDNSNQKNVEEQKIKLLKYENEKLKEKIKDVEKQHFRYLEQLEQLKNQKQNQTHKIIFKKDTEIRRYKSQIIELKLEIYKLQKSLDEKNVVVNNTIVTKKPYKTNFIKLINIKKKSGSSNNITKRSMKKTESDFFVTSQKISLPDNKKTNYEKIVITSVKKGDESKREEKEKNNEKKTDNNRLRIKKINNSFIKNDNKNKILDISNNTDSNAIIIKGGRNFIDENNEKTIKMDEILEKTESEKNSKKNESQKENNINEEDEKKEEKIENNDNNINKNESEIIKEKEKLSDKKKDVREGYKEKESLLIDELEDLISNKEENKEKIDYSEKQTIEENAKKEIITDESKNKSNNTSKMVNKNKSNNNKSKNESKYESIKLGEFEEKNSDKEKKRNKEEDEDYKKILNQKMNSNEEISPLKGRKKKFVEEEILVDFREEKSSQDKYKESNNDYNDFEMDYDNLNQIEDKN